LLPKNVALSINFCCPLDAPQAYLAHVVRAGIERRIDVDEVDLAPEAVGQEVGQHLLVVAVEQEAALRVGGGPVFPAVVPFLILFSRKG
jgi:hypothetical protein